MKINIVMPDHAKRISGGYLVIFTYANYLAERGHDVSIYYMLQEFMERKKLISVFQKPVASFVIQYWPKWFKLNEKVSRHFILKGSEIRDADILIATEIRTVALVNEQNESRGKKVYFIQDYESWICREEYVKSTYALGMEMIVISNWLKEIVDQYAVTPAHCIKDGIDSNIYKIIPWIERRKHSLTFHYRSAPHKGGDTAIAVAKELNKRYSDVIIDVITSEAELPELPDCCVRHIKIPPKQVAQINNSSKVFLCTSRMEGYGLPGLEAMACGAALVSTGYKGVFEYASNYNKVSKTGNAVLVDVDDVNALVNAVSDIFDHETDYEMMIKNGLNTAEYLTITKAGEQFEKVLTNLCS